VQSAPLAPTPQGWQRGPQPAAVTPPHPQPAPAPHAQQPAAAPPQHAQPPVKDNKKPDDPHKPGG
jgi:hypothetical protein